MFENFGDYLINLLLYRGRVGEVSFDLANNPDGSFCEPDGYLVLRPVRHYDDTRLPHEIKPMVVGFSIANRYMAREFTPALLNQVYTKAIKEGMNPMRLIWDGIEHTPYDMLNPNAAPTPTSIALAS